MADRLPDQHSIPDIHTYGNITMTTVIQYHNKHKDTHGLCKKWNFKHAFYSTIINGHKYYILHGRIKGFNSSITSIML